MSVYGMGSLFCGTEEQLDNFVNEGFVCIGWKKEDKPELYAIIEASFILREAIFLDEETDKKVKEMIKEAIPEK